MKLHSIQLGYLKNLPRPIQTKATQNRENKRGTTTQPTITRQCDIQEQRLSWPPHQNSVGPFRHDDSVDRSQRVEEFKSGSIYLTTTRERQLTQVYCPSSFTENSTEATISSNLLRYLNINSNLSSNSLIPKAQQATGPQSRNHSTTATILRSSIPATPVSKLVSIESPRGDELSTTNLTPNGDAEASQIRFSKQYQNDAALTYQNDVASESSSHSRSR
ncbi:hypothetical protein F511_19870 [Dorcoceras hygrometricum]|uniref:Uncharacterized protein n=1 Tax=Dorcoceras hygrometricum TaxID=472368 RepID=A0A2Z7ASL6_9LAMI|nr:hypothetical protein F511_19870 [Dorcoceras hygrometricum]